MFNRVIHQTDYILDVYDSIAEIYTITYNRSRIEEAYLRSIYPVISVDDITPDDYRLTWNNHHVKSEDRDSPDEYYGLIHEVYLTHMLGKDKQLSLQTISNVTFTESEIFVAFELIDAKTLEDVVRGGNIYTLLDALDALFIQLNFLYDNYEFTHYDLHNGNVLVDANNNLTIIDLQFSYANINGLDCGVTLYDDSRTLITPKQYWPFDAYKVLMSCRSISKDNITELLNTLLMFFVDITDYDRINSFSTLKSPPRIDYMPEYRKYLTSFDLFYEYFLNVKATYY